MPPKKSACAAINSATGFYLATTDDNGRARVIDGHEEAERGAGGESVAQERR